MFLSDLDATAKLLAKLTPDADYQPEWSESDRELAAALKLIHDALIAKEIARRPAKLNLCHGQRDGIDCMNFLFDLVNECAGYTHKYYNEIGAGKMSLK